jgi:hypothetical protein
LLPQTAISNAKMFAILKATEHSKHMHRKTFIMTDSLSSLKALERVYPGKNPTIPKVLNLKLMWGPAQTGIVDKAAEEALHEEPGPEIRATEN